MKRLTPILLFLTTLPTFAQTDTTGRVLVFDRYLISDTIPTTSEYANYVAFSFRNNSKYPLALLSQTTSDPCVPDCPKVLKPFETGKIVVACPSREKGNRVSSTITLVYAVGGPANRKETVRLQVRRFFK